MATGNMYFTCGSSVSKHKRMRAHIYTHAYIGSVGAITCKYMWSNAAFDSTLATPRLVAKNSSRNRMPGSRTRL